MTETIETTSGHRADDIRRMLHVSGTWFGTDLDGNQYWALDGKAYRDTSATLDCLGDYFAFAAKTRQPDGALRVTGQVPFDTFASVYTAELEKAVRSRPSEYAWPVDMVPSVAGRMMIALRAKTANKDSHAFRATCKRFGIKHTYQAIYAALGI